MIIENGKAKGIQLKDGSRIEAKQAVISTLSPHQLCYDLIGPDHLSPEILRKIDGLQSSNCTIGITFASSEHPKFKCSTFNNEINSEKMRHGINFFNLGPKNIESIFEQSDKVSKYRVPGGETPRPNLMDMIIQSDDMKLSRDPNICQFDLFSPAPPAWAQTPEYWLKQQAEYPEWQLNELRKYVDDVSWDNVLGITVRTPYWIAKHFRNMGPSGNVNIIDDIPSQMGSYRPIPELAQHRTPVANLYATGSAFGNWGMSSFCSSYTCYKVMSEDYGLRMPWNEKGRAY